MSKDVMYHSKGYEALITILKGKFIVVGDSNPTNCTVVKWCFSGNYVWLVKLCKF